jgi:hypothetical protein
VIIPYIHTVYLKYVHPLHYIFIPSSSYSPFFKQCLAGFIMLFSCVCVAHFDPPPLNILSFLPSTNHPPQFPKHIHSPLLLFIIISSIIIILEFSIKHTNYFSRTPRKSAMFNMVSPTNTPLYPGGNTFLKKIILAVCYAIVNGFILKTSNYFVWDLVPPLTFTKYNSSNLPFSSASYI